MSPNINHRGNSITIPTQISKLPHVGSYQCLSSPGKYTSIWLVTERNHGGNWNTFL